MAWGTDDNGAIFAWEQEVAQDLADEGCTGAAIPSVVERDGKYYPTCSSTGIIYAPPFDAAALAELLFPDEWSIIPPG